MHAMMRIILANSATFLCSVDIYQKERNKVKKIQKPLPGEHTPYAIAYIDLVPDDGLVLQHLQDDLQMVKELVGSQSEEKLTSRCAEGEWTIKEILVHVSDTERIMAYRALRFARNDTTPLPGFEQNNYVASSEANARSIEDYSGRIDCSSCRDHCSLQQF